MWDLYYIIRSSLRRNIGVHLIKWYAEEKKSHGEAAGVDDSSTAATGTGSPCVKPHNQTMSFCKYLYESVMEIQIWMIKIHKWNFDFFKSLMKIEHSYPLTDLTFKILGSWRSMARFGMY